ncbi:hypothetical protein [Ewingella americana]|uniref:Uncharacterized protein n=1 Tax=Ewingella americana TaxID=41202 RepID=A0A502GDN4_9GAMM|nr:hypothetical protein [Ewingella americana]TPG59974.1 hypothetical protein EAH77_15520 [Ewingella americana]
MTDKNEARFTSRFILETYANIQLPLVSEKGVVGRRGFSNIRILDVHYDMNGVVIDYQIDSKKYLAEMMNTPKKLVFNWGLLDTSDINPNDLNLNKLKLSRGDNCQNAVTFKQIQPLIYNLILQCFVGPVAFSSRLSFDLENDNIYTMIETVVENQDQAQLIVSAFYKTANIERNNMRYAMGATSKGYFEPLKNVQSGLAGLIGDFESEYEMPFGTEPLFNEHTEESGLRNTLSAKLSEDSEVAVNCSFGKESLFTYEFMMAFTGQAPHISVFQHITNDDIASGQYQSTYLKKVFTDLGHKGDEDPRHIFICQSNFLSALLEPICDVRLGAPICMLTHVFSMAQLINIKMNQSSKVDIQMLLSGDEYERSISQDVAITSQSTSHIHTYDYEQSPDIANTINNIYGNIMPNFGSIMYPITGYQGQMVLDKVFKYGHLQTSCHASHVHNGGNCGKCQKCLRIGTVKSLAGTNNLDYKLTDKQISETVSWSSSDFFVTSMPADKDEYLSKVHRSFEELNQYRQNPNAAHPFSRTRDYLGMMVETPTHPNVLDAEGEELMQSYLNRAAFFVIEKYM